MEARMLIVSIRKSLALIGLAIAIVLVAPMAQAAVLLPNGEYTTSVEGLRVKVLGGQVVINRTWANSQWYVNPAWADIKFTYDALDGSVKAIDRSGASYLLSGNNVFIFDQRFFIKTT